MYRRPAAPIEALELSGLIRPGAWWRCEDRRVEAYLGPRVVAEACGYASLDRARRVRFVSSERRVRFEELDPASGITSRSYRASACPRLPVSAPHGEPLAIWHAFAHGRSTCQVCFDGYPGGFGGRPRATTARLLRVLEYEDGVRLDRISANGSLAGDSWHTNMAAALRQLRYEYASHIGVLRTGRGCPPPSAPRTWT